MKRRKPETTPPPLALPGMDQALREQQDAAAQLLAEEMTLMMLAPPCKSINEKTRNIERESPLFKGTGADGQKDLF